MLHEDDFGTKNWMWVIQGWHISLTMGPKKYMSELQFHTAFRFEYPTGDSFLGNRVYIALM
jgi:hypothetical protein